MSTRRHLALVATLCLALAGCGGDDDEEPIADEEPVTDEAADDEAAGDATGELATASSDLGEILVDDAGMSLYVFDPDEGGESTCYDDCAESWPPLEGPAEAGEGVDAALLGTTERTDGTVQVTYDGWPLYRFAADTAAGDIAGQGVNEVWWLVSPDGEKITDQADASSSTY